MPIITAQTINLLAPPPTIAPGAGVRETTNAQEETAALIAAIVTK
jgi:hypothetical protein